MPSQNSLCKIKLSIKNFRFSTGKIPDFRPEFTTLGLAKTKNSSGRNVFIAPGLGINLEDNVTEAKPIMDALYNTYPDVLDRLRAEMGIQKGIVMSEGDNFEDLLKQGEMIAMRREALFRSKEDIVYIRKGGIVET